MDKVKLHEYIDRRDGMPDYAFFCPGCQCLHGVWVRQTNKNNAIWSFNNDKDKPTFSPSLMIKSVESKNGQVVETICHTYVREGMIQFLGDCTHELRGQTVEMPYI